MAVEIMAARRLTDYAARASDEGRRCDPEVGMAKLLAARVAWPNADNVLQIHGGEGVSCCYNKDTGTGHRQSGHLADFPLMAQDR